jgi:hypothetical protein
MAISPILSGMSPSIVGAAMPQRIVDNRGVVQARGESPAAIVTLSPEAKKLLLAIPPPEVPVLALDRASDRDGDGTIDQPDLNGDGQPDGLDMNADGVQDIPPESALQRELRDQQGEEEPKAAEVTDPESAAAGRPLSEDEKKVLGELRARDAEVRAHEMAHKAAGGGMTGAISYTYQTGPDGKAYAIGGEVSISAAPGSSPEETIRRAQAVRAAALAPASPSGADMAAASAAGKMESQARAQLTQGGESEGATAAKGLAGFRDGTAAEAALSAPSLESYYFG